jgi:hypothetical protein
VVIDGQLVEMEVVPGEELPGPTHDEVYAFYCMAMWHARAKGLKPGWSYYATQRRFKLDAVASKRLIPLDWRYSEPLPPSDEAARWFKADWLRARYAREYQQKHGVQA